MISFAAEGLPQRGPPCSFPLTEHDKVTMVIAAHRRPRPLFCTLASLLCQTWPHFEIIVAHSGPGPEIKSIVDAIGDPRIKYIEVERNPSDYGGHCRQAGFDIATGNWIGTTSDDNYYAPVYFAWMLSKAKTDGADFVYCNMVHSITGWCAFITHPHIGAIDAGGWLCRAKFVKETNWPPAWHGSDGVYVESLLRAGAKATKVDGFIFTHN